MKKEFFFFLEKFRGNFNFAVSLFRKIAWEFNFADSQFQKTAKFAKFSSHEYLYP